MTAHIKHLTKAMMAELHYIPANNVFANYMVEGEKAGAEIKRISGEMYERAIQEGCCPTCMAASTAWYLASCAIVLNRMIAGGKASTDYPAFVNPCPDAQG